MHSAPGLVVRLELRLTLTSYPSKRFRCSRTKTTRGNKVSGFTAQFVYFKGGGDGDGVLDEELERRRFREDGVEPHQPGPFFTSEHSVAEKGHAPFLYPKCAINLGKCRGGRLF
ncbi:hypothetical protein Y032_0620g741 [Ancylostoma ceylanicum]|uniref:Uncharacterized protein n=1 Tax=Ancylostoma ceylanicum TaxID=53326 RepID=A0A016WKY2_9BILA|nr:hypothetical protein Y032_0620g741 [Ancylostoma ceylanicum]